MSRKLISTALLGAGLTGAILLAGCGGNGGSSESTAIPQPTQEQLVAAGFAKLPLAPEDKRVDLSLPPFSHGTEVTNPLFPISDLHSTVLNGVIDGKPFHTETTLLPYTRTFEWGGQKVETLVSQYNAFLDGRIAEVAIDYYAQDDNGSVWYFGEDVYDYNPEGVVYYTTDSWLTGKDGPPAMIMPADPKIGDAFRTENIPGHVFEEVDTVAIDRTVDGPSGPVAGAMIGRELHDDGAVSNKVFAPGYGEFQTKDADGIEAMALAVPTDALDTPPPAELEAIGSGADNAFAAVESRDWGAASKAAQSVNTAWEGFRQAEQVPPRLEPPMTAAIAAMSDGVKARDQVAAATGAIDVAQAALDLELRYRPPDEIDLARLEQWARQLGVDARAADTGGAYGDLATMEWTRDRVTDGIDATDLTRINVSLLAMRDALIDKDLAAAGEEASKLQDTLAAPLN